MAMMGASAYIDSNKCLISHPIPSNDSDASNHIVPNKEAVAALSATLAFRRFALPPATQTTGDEDDCGDCGHTDESSSHGLRRLSGILRGRDNRMRRASLDTILSSSASNHHHDAGAGSNLRCSLRCSLRSNDDIFELTNIFPSTPTDAVDESSLNSEDDDGDGLERIMADYNHMSPDNTKIASLGNYGCNSDDDTFRDSSIAIDLLEKGDSFSDSFHTYDDSKGGSSARGFASSLQRLFGSPKVSSVKCQISNKNTRRRTTFGSSSGSSNGYNPKISRKNQSTNSNSWKKTSFQRSSSNTSWKDKSSFSGSGCLKHPNNQDDLTSSRIAYSSSPKAARRNSRVSWKIDDFDDNVFGIPLVRPSVGFSSDNNNIDNNIDLEAPMATTASAAMETDEELLASMILASSHGSLLSRISSQRHKNRCTTKNAAVRRQPSSSNDTPEETVDTIGSLDGGNQSETSTVQQEEDITSRLTGSKVATVATVTRLAYQEVEDYRLRLQRKRESMLEEERMDTGTANTIGPPSQDELENLNCLLQENATNISNALLMQRALYILGGVPSPAGAVTESNRSNDKKRIRMSRSYHSGMDRMALNHFVALSSSATSGISGNSNANNNTIISQPNAQWSAVPLHATTPDNSLASNPRESSFINPFSSVLGRRHTRLERTGESSSQTLEAAETLQIGAYQSNEPAPMLFRRTFASVGHNRREAREEARRHTMLILARERQSNSSVEVSGEVIDSDSDNSSIDSSCELHPNNSFSYNNNDNSNMQRQQQSNTDESTSHTTSTSPTPSSSLSSNNFRLLDDLPATNVGRINGAGPQNDRQNLQGLLNASARWDSLDPKRMLQAILVSDEIVEADHLEPTECSFRTRHSQNHLSSMCTNCATPFGDEEDPESLLPLLREQLVNMEELMKKQDDERRDVVWQHHRRERVLVVLLVVSVVISIALIIVIATAYH